MTIELIDERIKKLRQEADILSASHDATVKRYQEAMSNNLNRFQQIRGQITELEWVKTQLNGETPHE